MIDWNQFLNNFAFTGLLGAIIVFLGKQAIKSSFEANAEEYKMGLQKLRFEHEVEYLEIYKRRIEVVENLWDKVLIMQGALERYTALFGDEKERAINQIETYNAYRDCSNYFKRNRIFLSASLCEKFDLFMDRHWRIFGEFTANQIYLNDPDGASVKRAGMKWLEINKEVLTEFKTFVLEIEALFREMVGGDITYGRLNYHFNHHFNSDI